MTIEFKLPKAKKTKWVKALRSGKYTQGKKKLKRVMGSDIPGFYNKLAKPEFCCLGVACDIGIAKPKSDGYYAQETFMPGDLQQTLANMNDSGKWSFKSIAKWIEENL